MNEYLSRKNRNNTLIAYILWDTMKKWADNDQNQLTKEEMKYARMASSYMKKLGDSIVSRVSEVNQDFADRLVKQVNRSTIELTENIDSANRVIVELEPFYKMADFALAAMCRGCKNTCHKKCELYKALVSMDIPVANTIRQKGECPYQL